MGFRVIGLDRSEALIEQARARTANALFLCADLLSWRPSEMATGVRCRGVLNDLTIGHERRAALGAFRSWLRPGGVLLADVRDWEATVARYAAEARFTSVELLPGGTAAIAPDRLLLIARR